jgi:hypothetical protein
MVAEDLFIGWLSKGPQVPNGDPQLMPYSWLVAAGKNPVSHTPPSIGHISFGVHDEPLETRSLAPGFGFPAGFVLLRVLCTHGVACADGCADCCAVLCCAVLCCAVLC